MRHLTHSEETVYDWLKDGQWHSLDDILTALYSNTPEYSWPDTNVIKVFICGLRKKIDRTIINGRERYKMLSVDPEPRQAVPGDLY